ncbi:hypothetical protein J2S09_004306 [Bacillus fengqiuensis]|nr:hypothetical protein [Bacillus fengqiuensis]
MSIREVKLQVDDYLDLYLYAETMGDQTWQQEILEKLQSFYQESQFYRSFLPL